MINNIRSLDYVRFYDAVQMEPRYDFTSRFLNINFQTVQDFLGQDVHSIERKFNVIIVLVFLIQDMLKEDSDFFAQLRVSELSLKRQCIYYIY